MMPCHNSGDRISHMDRKAKKPLMEKRRRARINKCLGDLKSLLLEHLKRDPSQTSKLEKADILEMTVHLIRRMQQEQLMRASLVQPAVKDRFLEGWRDCAAQVSHYANTVDGMPPPLKESLQGHLAERYRTLRQTLSMHSMPGSIAPSSSAFQRGPTSGPPFPAMAPLSIAARTAVPILYPPALPPSAFIAVAAAAQWQRGAAVTVHRQPTIPSSIFDPTKLIDDAEVVVKQQLQNVVPALEGQNERPASSTSNSRVLAQTPECYADDGEDEDEDSASCSSSDATNESRTPDGRGVKDHVWRPW